QPAPEQEPVSANVAAAPAAVEQNASVEQARAQLKMLERAYFPRFSLEGAAYARGSGAALNGNIAGGANGLAPTTQNYALGLNVTFPIFDRASIRAQEAEQAANMRAESARYQQVLVDLRARWNAALATLSGARRVAANMPAQLQAAHAATAQATA